MEKKRSQFLNLVSQKASTSDHITKVLLVCVYNKSGTLITHDIYYRLFSKYGEVFRILIFQKSKVWKTFLEMDTLESAIEAKKMLHNHVLFEDGSRMKIFFSNLETINFQNKNSGGVDYSEIKQHISGMSFLMKEKDNILQGKEGVQDSSFHSQPTDSPSFLMPVAHQMLIRPSFSSSHDIQQFVPSQSEESPLEEHKFISSATQLDHFDKILFSKNEDEDDVDLLEEYEEENVSDKIKENTKLKQEIKSPVKDNTLLDFKKNLDKSLQKLDLILEHGFEQQNPREARPTTVSAMQEVIPKFQLQLPQQHQRQVVVDTSSIKSQQNTSQRTSQQHQQPFTDPSTYVNPLFLLENRKSAVIYVRGLDSPSIKIDWLMNLFMNFGNVTQICFMHDKLAALIEFQEVEFATQAKDFLNGTYFMGNTLKIFYSNYSSIDARKGSQNEEIIKGVPDRFRFALDKKPYSINPPSQILHISGLRAEACSYEVIVSLFSAYGNIEAVKFLVKDNYKHMCLVRFSTMEQSFQAMAEMQGKEVCGRHILLSFTRSKI